MEVEIHASCLADEGEETVRSIFLCYVDAFGGNDIEVLALNLLQHILSAAGDAYLPALGGEYLDHLEPDARGGAHDDGSLCFHLFFIHNCKGKFTKTWRECIVEKVKNKLCALQHMKCTKPSDYMSAS